MDANGQRFWLLADAAHWPLREGTTWAGGCRRLQLASARRLEPVLDADDASSVAETALEMPSRAVDAFECTATWVPAAGGGGHIEAQSHLPESPTLLTLAQDARDLCVGADGILYVALPDRVRLHDLRGRFRAVNALLADFRPWRLAPRPQAHGGGVWVLDRPSGRLALLQGRPLREPVPQPEDYDGDVFRPDPENAEPERIDLLAAPDWGAERPVALAAAPDGALALLSWLDGNGQAALRLWLPAPGGAGGEWSRPRTLQGAAFAYALAWVAPRRVVLRVPGRRDAPAFEIEDGADAGTEWLALGAVYPLAADANEAPFGNGAVMPPRYPAGTRGSEPLHALSLTQCAPRGEAHNFRQADGRLRAHLLDSGDTSTVWHRLYAEALIPPHGGFVVWLAATNEPVPPRLADRTAWHPHAFGRDIRNIDADAAAPHVPQAAWQREPSELPGHPGLLGGRRAAGEQGLFGVLIQCARQRVRKLIGRFLWVRVVLHGNRQGGPEIAALRAWGSRFDYAEKYLPRLHHETLFGAEARRPGVRLTTIDLLHRAGLDAGRFDAALRTRLQADGIEPGPMARVMVERTGRAWLIQDGTRGWRLELAADEQTIELHRPQASAADFNARLLANFESVLTPLEDRVAAAHLHSSAAVTPEAHLPWLASWIGVAFDPALDTPRRRAWLQAAPALARAHGSAEGLRLALDVATGGGVRGGEIIVIEDFRLRRLLATLLGVDLDDEADPLLPGLYQSGNSVVGDTLVLGDTERVELMALFRDAQSSAAEDSAVLDFYARLAHRATVLVHREVATPDFALIRRIASAEAPAHVEVNVRAASWPLLVGISSLVGVDTYLAPPRGRRPARVQRSVLGLGDHITALPVLDPRLSGRGGLERPPQARLLGPGTVAQGRSFELDGSASSAAPGHVITEYRWQWLADPS